MYFSPGYSLPGLSDIVQMKYFIKIIGCLVATIFLLLFAVNKRVFDGALGISYVLTASMEPALKVGSLVIFTKGGDYKIGDIVTFASPRSGEVISHRVVDSEEVNGNTLYVTKGDRNDLNDPWKIDNSQVLGKVAVALPFLGSLAVFGKTIKGLILLVYIPALLISLNEVSGVVREFGRLAKPLKKAFWWLKRNDIIRL